MCRVDAVILASGLSRRMGGTNKLLLPLGDATVLGRFLARFPFTYFESVIVVYHDEQVAAIAEKFPVTRCCNDNPELGKSRSIRLGLAATEANNGVMFTVADQPLLTPVTLCRLVEVFCDNPDKIVLPEVNGSPANPVTFPADLRPELQKLQGDCGGRQILRRYPERVRAVPFSSGHEFFDIDTPAMYQEAVEQWKLEN